MQLGKCAIFRYLLLLIAQMSNDYNLTVINRPVLQIKDAGYTYQILCYPYKIFSFKIKLNKVYFSHFI